MALCYLSVIFRVKHLYGNLFLYRNDIRLFTFYRYCAKQLINSIWIDAWHLKNHLFFKLGWVLTRGLDMLFLLLCIALLILIVAVFYFIRLNKKSMDVTQFIDLLYKDDEEKWIFKWGWVSVKQNSKKFLVDDCRKNNRRSGPFLYKCFGG